jgi:hypothetical protein
MDGGCECAASRFTMSMNEWVSSIYSLAVWGTYGRENHGVFDRGHSASLRFVCFISRIQIQKHNSIPFHSPIYHIEALVLSIRDDRPT